MSNPDNIVKEFNEKHYFITVSFEVTKHEGLYQANTTWHGYTIHSERYSHPIEAVANLAQELLDDRKRQLKKQAEQEKLKLWKTNIRSGV